MTMYDVATLGTITSGALATSARKFSAAQTPTVFLIFGPRPGGTEPLVQCYHRMTPFLPHMGMPASRWDRQAFASSGGLVGNQISTIVWDNGYVDALQENPIMVLTNVAISEALALLPNVQMTAPPSQRDRNVISYCA